MDNKYILPFDKSYVLSTTFKHMIKSVNISIDKTFARLAEFDDNSEKAREVFETLSELHSVRKALEGTLNGHTNRNKGS